MSPKRKQITKTAVCAILGATPGTIWFALTGTPFPSLLVAVLGAFIVGALSSPGVSAANVAKGTVGMVAAHNVPRPLQGKVFDAIAGDGTSKDDETADEAQPSTTGASSSR